MGYRLRVIVFSLALVLVSCGVKKQVVQTVAEEPADETSWHTCLIQGTRATVYRNGEPMTSSVVLQTVRDSMIVISVTPVLGMEVMRLEATPLEIRGFDKMHGQYAEATFAEINRQLRPELNWDQLQEICIGELQGNERMARLFYTFGDEFIEVVLEYGERRIDVPVKVYNLPTARYQKIDISRWL